MSSGPSPERVAVLEEVRELVERKRSDWEHIDSAEQALKSVLEELDALIKTSTQACVDTGRFR